MAYTLFQKLALGLVCATLPVSAIAAPKEPLRLKPSSKWIADYPKDGCRLIRQFGEGDDKSLIVMSRFAPSEYFSLTFAGKPFKQLDPVKAKVQFGPDEAEQEANFWDGKYGELPSLVMTGEMRLAPFSAAELTAISAAQKKPKDASMIRIEPVSVEREKRITFVKISRPLRTPVVLELGSMDRPMAALNTCITDLVNGWGLDAEKHKTMSRPVRPINVPGSWMSSGDYPIKMLNAGQPAIVEFRLDVDETGRATGCHIQQTTRPQEFDNAVCSAIMRKAKLSPALDAQGQPMKSYYQSTVNFRL
jgi:Gram-negative bacterial TonB protein C-terminal